MKWQEKLTKDERRHMMQWCGRSIAGLKRNLAAAPGGCLECRHIARKLGIDPDTGEKVKS
jgi:hypothetical protein